jgi:biotin transport system substrate-specific component
MQKQYINKKYNIAVTGVLVALFSVSAFLRIPTPFMPLTLQVFVVLLAPMIFGFKVSFAALFLYIVLGLIGFPIFSLGGGPAYVLQPSFGYLIGFLLSSIPSGLISARTNKLPVVFLGGLLALAVMEGFGTLGLWLNIHFYQGKDMGFLPVAVAYAVPYYLPDFVKLLVAVPLSWKLRKALNRFTSGL